MRHSSKEVLEDLKLAAAELTDEECRAQDKADRQAWLHKPVTKEEAEKEATFLYKWSKGKPIRFYSPGSTFWAAGKWMTKLTPAMINGLVEFGFAKELRRGVIGWKKEPSLEAQMMGTAPDPDVEGITEIVINKPEKPAKPAKRTRMTEDGPMEI